MTVGGPTVMRWPKQIACPPSDHSELGTETGYAINEPPGQIAPRLIIWHFPKQEKSQLAASIPVASNRISAKVSMADPVPRLSNVMILPHSHYRTLMMAALHR
jgi:hypothetical protein